MKLADDGTSAKTKSNNPNSYTIMGAFIAKQPNGLYCRFSTFLDTVTNYDMTEQDYIDMCVENAIEEAEETLKKAMPFERVKDQFMPSNDSIEDFDKLVKKMGDPEGLGADRIQSLKREFEDE